MILGRWCVEKQHDICTGLRCVQGCEKPGEYMKVGIALHNNQHNVCVVVDARLAQQRIG